MRVGVTILAPSPVLIPGGAEPGRIRRTHESPGEAGARRRAEIRKERAMYDRLISGDNHIDLTYCPPDLWSSQAPNKWKLLVPRVEELEDGLHWFVDA